MKSTGTTHAALSFMKATGTQNIVPPSVGIENILPMFLADKGYNPLVTSQLAKAKIFGRLIQELLLKKQQQASETSIWDYFGTRAPQMRGEHPALHAYTGSIADALDADRFITMANSQRTFIGQGATGFVSVPAINLPRGFAEVPIAVIGAGPAGLMVRRGLRLLGFHNVKTFEKREAFGIWSQENVYEGSRNNPRDVLFDRVAKLTAAPGEGREVRAFLDSLRDHEEKRRTVEGVEPGDLEHTLVFDKDKKEKFPIVVNAMGLGKPVPMNDPTRMVGPDNRVPATRWQIPNLKTSDVQGKRFIFIGLGNSTAEMIRQLHEFEDEGVDVDYRILTHYPRDSVYGPSDVVHADGKNYRVFRDISKPQLVSYQGDLPDARSDYFRALMNGKIIPNVKKWNVSSNGKVLAAYSGKSDPIEIPFNKLYALAGYAHSADDYKKMGCTYDKELDCALHDYDGEIIRKKNVRGIERLHRGYFGFGAVLDAPHNPNTVVIPGMAFRLPDLLFGIVMRAGEYVHKNRAHHRVGGE